jgi:hypothetical protein
LGQQSPAFSRSSQHDPRNWERPTSTHKASGWNRASALHQRRRSRVALAALAAEVPLELRPLRARDSIAQASGRPDGVGGRPPDSRREAGAREPTTPGHNSRCYNKREESYIYPPASNISEVRSWQPLKLRSTHRFACMKDHS